VFFVRNVLDKKKNNVKQIMHVLQIFRGIFSFITSWFLFINILIIEKLKNLLLFDFLPPTS